MLLVNNEDKALRNVVVFFFKLPCHSQKERKEKDA